MKINRKTKVAVGMSGGVDSAVSALLLKQQGYDVTGVYIECWKEPGCRAEQDRTDALKVCLQLGIPFKRLNFIKEYKEQVMEYFYNEYEQARTPNPDILCNSVIKFGLFYEWALREGYGFVATGHYTQVMERENNESVSHSQFFHTKHGVMRYDKSDLKSVSDLSSKEKSELGLFTARDLKKDQSYFLYRLRQEQLSRILFPVGGLYKSQVREIARENKLCVADKKDSMGICFVGNVNVPELLEKRFGKKKGRVVLTDGRQIGEHNGYWNFNVGKRGAFKLKTQNSKLKTKTNKSKMHSLDFANLPKLYVIGIDKDKNEVVVGERSQCMRGSFVIEDCLFYHT